MWDPRAPGIRGGRDVMFEMKDWTSCKQDKSELEVDTYIRMGCTALVSVVI